MKRAIVFLSCVAVITLLWPMDLIAQEGELKREFKETLLVDLAKFNTVTKVTSGMKLEKPGDIYLADVKASPNLRHIALVVVTFGNKWSVVLDGEMQRKFDAFDMSSLKFSPDGERLFYAAVKDTATGIEEIYTVVDSKPYGPYNILATALFSPDSKHVAYFASLENKWFFFQDMVQDRSRSYDDIASNRYIKYSPDSSRVAFGVKIGEKKHMVVDGVVSPELDGNGKVLFSPDSRRLAYSGHVGEDFFLIIDGVISPAYKRISEPCFSPDSKRICYSVEREGKLFVLVNDQESKPYDGMSENKWFSPDSKRLAFAASRGKDTFMVIDNVERPVSGWASMTTFSPDSSRIAYMLMDKKKNSYFAVDEALYGPFIGSVPAIFFSPDSSKVAFGVMVKKNKGYVMLDGVAGKTYRWIGDLCFSPDSQHLVYGARDKKTWYVVLDGKEIATHKDAGSFIFSPDSNHLLYAAQDKKGKSSIFVDGAEGQKYDQIFKPPTPKEQMSRNIIFDGPDSFHYMAMKGSKIYLVEEKIISAVPDS